MRRILPLLILLVWQNSKSQTFSTNLTPVGWEHNILFNATTRYTVTQQGPVQNLKMMFDGSMNPNYIANVSTANPSVILIEGLAGYHTQSGAWVGWTTRYLPTRRFKIEGYDTYNAANVWRIITDYSTVDYSGLSFSVKVPIEGVYSKLKFTFYQGQGGTVGLSELFFIHPEATTPYAGLLSSSLNNWQIGSGNLIYNSGNVGIGTSAPGNKLDVNGTIHSKEVKVDVTGWPDYVFKKEYNLPRLDEVEKHINEKGYLKNIPSEEEALKSGISLGEMNAKLLEKIEELTLYIIQQNKEIQTVKKENSNCKLMSDKFELLQQEINCLKSKLLTKN